ncbi:MAG: hypothetical protein COA32_17495 [Fluviicola sp.]|nr:MAG: hypothetical protein COA32_17495 [Fluviicola sp.]
MKKTLEIFRKIFWYLSMLSFLVALYCPTYCTNVECSGPASGLSDFLFGWLGALFFGGVYCVWFANPFYITAIFTNKKVPILALIFSIIGLFAALTFLNGGTVVLNEAGHTAYITKFQIGYWLWMSSMGLMTISSIFSVLVKYLRFKKNVQNITKNH